MDKLDKFERLAWDSQYAVGILGNGTEFELVDLGPERMSDERNRELQEKKFGFVGIIGITKGVPRVALAVPLDPMTISALSQALAQRIEDGINKVEKAMTGDSTEFLRRLYDLRDDRSEMN